MHRPFFMGLLCVATALPPAMAETFVIEADKAGHEATIKIPAGAVTRLSADRAESLEGYAGSQIEAMRLSGDVLIGIAGSRQPIEINSAAIAAKHSRADSASHNRLRDSQVLVGNVVFDLQTASGPVEIKADRIEHQLTSKPGV
jgi:nicotinamide mononucleotide (NMN) deamidase PncC